MDFKVGFKPKLFSTFKNGYNKQTLVQDMLAGIIVPYLWNEDDAAERRDSA